MTVTGDKDNKSGAIASDLKFKFSDKAKGVVLFARVIFKQILTRPLGLTFTQTVKTSNVITALLEADGLIAPGLKTDLEGSLTDVG